MEKSIHTFWPEKHHGFNVALSGIMLRFMATTYIHIYFQTISPQKSTNEGFLIRAKDTTMISTF